MAMSLDMLKDAVAAIIAAADEVKQEGEKEDNMAFGQLLAYAEVLCILRDACDPTVLAEIGLDFDIDARYLITEP